MPGTGCPSLARTCSIDTMADAASGWLAARFRSTGCALVDLLVAGKRERARSSIPGWFSRQAC